MVKVTDKEASDFLQKIEVTDPGFRLADPDEVFNELLGRFRRRQEGLDQEICPKLWPVMTESFGGLGCEDLVVLTGETGRGKTTFFTLYMVDLLSQGFPCFVAPLEGGFSSFAKRLGEIVLQKPEKSWSMADIGSFKEIMATFGQMYIYQPGGVAAQDRIINAMRYCVLKYDVKFCVIDHLGFIRLDIRGGINGADAIGNLLKRFKGFNADYGVPVLLIAHPAKSGDRGFSDGREIGMDELKGSSDIKQLADTVMSLFRFREQTAVRFQKIRNSDYAKNTGLGISFEYDHKKSRLVESCFKPQKFRDGQ